MSLAIKYESLQEAKMRLEGSVVLYDSKPVYISQVTEVNDEERKSDIFRVYAVPLPLEDIHNLQSPIYRKYISSNKFDFAPFKMGFLEYGNQAVYCSRTPVRQQKQGLSSGSLTYQGLGEDRIRADFIAIIKSEQFLRMQEGRYDSTPEVSKRLLSDDKTKSLPLARTFAVSLDRDLDLMLVWHKNRKIGLLDMGKVKIAKKHLYIREELEEAKLPIF